MLPWAVTGTTWFTDWLIFRPLLMRASLLRTVHSAKWSECHRHSQAFLGYADRWFITSKWLCSGPSSIMTISLFWVLFVLYFSALQGLLLLKWLPVSWTCTKAPSSSNGKLVVKGGVRSSSETCVGAFRGAGEQKDQGRAGLFQWPSKTVLWTRSTSSTGIFPAIAIVSIS